MLKLFSQYILTPLVFIYLLILLAYLVKIVIGGEWPSGWIGWLVTSVAVAGLLGFLLIHPLRDDPDEPWIRTYSRGLFVGLIPAAIMLLVAFWKRIIPYGLTELRLLGILLGFWLLVIAVWYTVRQRAGIRLIPLTLAILLLVTVYGPHQRDTALGSEPGQPSEDADIRSPKRAAKTIAKRVPRSAFFSTTVPGIEIGSAIAGRAPGGDWAKVQDNRNERDSTASLIMAAAGMRYLSEHSFIPERLGLLLGSAGRRSAYRGYQWTMPVSPHDSRLDHCWRDSIHVVFDTLGIARVIVGQGHVAFDLRPLARAIAPDSTIFPHE